MEWHFIHWLDIILCQLSKYKCKIQKYQTTNQRILTCYMSVYSDTKSNNTVIFHVLSLLLKRRIFSSSSKLTCWKGLRLIKPNFSLYFQLSSVLLSQPDYSSGFSFTSATSKWTRSVVYLPSVFPFHCFRYR